MRGGSETRVDTLGMWIISSKEIRLHADKGPVHAVITDGESLPRRRTRERRRGAGQGEVLVESRSPHSKCRPPVRRLEPSQTAAFFFASFVASSLIRVWQKCSVWPGWLQYPQIRVSLPPAFKVETFSLRVL